MNVAKCLYLFSTVIGASVAALHPCLVPELCQPLAAHHVWGGQAPEQVQCYFQDDPEEVCLLNAGESGDEECGDTQCQFNATEEDWYCNIAKARTFENGAYRSRVSMQDAYEIVDDKITEIFDGGSNEIATESLACFTVENCFSGVGNCVAEEGVYWCTYSSITHEDSEDAEEPHPGFPCPD